MIESCCDTNQTYLCFDDLNYLVCIYYIAMMFHVVGPCCTIVWYYKNELAVCIISTVPYDHVKLCCELLYDHVGREC